MKNALVFGFFLIFLTTLSSCAPEPVCETLAEGHSYSFFGGLMHGLALPIALIGKIFGVETGLYAVNNSGILYWIGYLLGFLVWGGGASRL